jgi:hypothetical protein
MVDRGYWTPAATAILLTLAAMGCAAAGAPARIEVDARQAPRGVMTAHLELPVVPGPLTLVYPKWLPGYHTPSGPLTSLGGPRADELGTARRPASSMLCEKRMQMLPDLTITGRWVCKNPAELAE